MLRRAVVIVLAGALATGLIAEEDLDPQKPAARVNGEEIKIGQLERECVARFGAGTLQQMIDLMIVEQAAKKRGVSVTDEEVAKRLIAMQLQIEARKRQTGMGFLQWSAMRRITLRELASMARMELLLEKMVADKVKVTDEDVARYYQNNRDMFRQKERMLISHITVEKPDEAERIRRDIVAGKITFADAARKYSIDPYGRENGGVFGWIVRGNDPIQREAFKLQKDGDISPVFRSRKGYTIVRRDAYQSARVLPFEEVQDKIRAMLKQQRTQRLAQQMMEELRRAADVERLIDFQLLNRDIQPIIDAASKLTKPKGEQAGGE